MKENIQKVILTADDRTKSAFSQFRKNVTSSDDAVSKLQKTSALLRTGLAGLGVSVSGVAFVGMIRNVADAQDQLAKMSQQTGVAVETLAGLEFAASQSGTSIDVAGKAIKSFSRIILEADGGTDKYSRLIKALGLDLEALKKATPEEQFISLSGAIRDNVSEQERGAVVTALLGQRYTQLIPLLAQGEQGLRDMIEQGQKLNPVTAQSAAQAELFNDNVDKLQRTFKSFSVQAANQIIPSLARITTEMAEASERGGILIGILSGIGKAAASVPGVEELAGFFNPLLKQRIEAQRYEQLLERLRNRQIETISAINDAGSAPGANSFSELLDDINVKSGKASTSVRNLNKSLSEEERQVQETANEIQRLTIRFDPLIARNKELSDLIDLRNRGLSEDIFDAAAAESINKYIKATEEITDGVEDIDTQTQQLQVTMQQVFDTNEQIAISGVRGIQNAFADGLFNFFDDGLEGMVRSVKNAVGRMVAEFASVKLLQSTGLVGALGLGSGAAFASGGGSGVSAFDVASLGTGALNLLNSGFGARDLIGAGISNFGNFAGLGNVTAFGQAFTGDAVAGFAGTGGSLGAAAGSAVPYVAAAAGADLVLRQLFGDKKLGGTAGDILSYVPVVGTLINGIFGRGAPKFNREELVGTVSASGFEGVLNQGFKEKGGLARSSRFSNFIADTDTGQLLNQFGRLSESGNIPGALRDSATDPAIKRALEVGQLLDDTFITLSTTLKSTADILGISADGLKTFNAELDLVSEKGETLSQQQISDAIADISNQMAETLIPSIDDLSRSGESSTDTLSRLGAEFKSLETALLFTGESAEQARTKIQGLSFEQRTEITDQFGGAAAFNAQLDSFFNNVLDESKQLEIVEARARDVAKSFGLDFIPTLDQLADGFAKGSWETRKLITENDDLVVLYQSLRESVEGLGETTREVSKEVSNFTNEDFKDMMRVIAQERRSFTAARREQQAGGLAPTIATTIGGRIFTADDIKAQQQTALSRAFEQAKSVVEEQISRLDESMRNARDMIRDQISGVRESINFFSKFREDALEVSNSSFAASKAQLEASISLIRAGAELDQIDTPELAKAIDTLKQDRSQFFSTSKEFELDKARTAQKIEELSLVGTSRADQTISLLTDQLGVMQATYDLQAKRLNGTLDFINFQGGVSASADPSRLSDTDLGVFAANSLESLNQAERIRRNTSFNGSVQFAFPAGTNESADAADAARLRQLNTFVSQAQGSNITSDLKEELAQLKREIAESKQATENMFNLFLNMTDNGRILNVKVQT